MMDEKQEMHPSQPSSVMGHVISRRKLLASIGVASVATVSGGLLKLAHANGVTEAVYGTTPGIGGVPAGSGTSQLTPNELMSLTFCLATTIAELRGNKHPLTSQAYYVTDAGREGFFLYDAADTTSADNTGTVIVAASGARFKRIAENHSLDVKWFGAEGDGTADDTAAIQAALDEAANRNGCKVVVPDGTYKLTKELYIYANTTLSLAANAVLLRCHGNNILFNYRTSDVFYGYGGNGNITIEGGTFDCNAKNYPHICSGIALAHAENITIKQTTVKDLPAGHAIELTGVRKVMIGECKFLGFKDDGSRYFSEAIQLEPATKDGFSGYSKDCTGTEQVTVRDCYFGNSGTPGMAPWPAGVASHSSVADVYYDRITVTNNTFEESSYWSIRPFKWTNAIVTGNLIKNVKGGIFVTTPAAGSESAKDADGNPRPPQPASSIVIDGNIIDMASGVGIYVEGQPEARNHKVVITGNIIKNTSDHMIYVKYSDLCVISNNILENGKKNGCILLDCTNSEIRDNLLRNMAYYGFNIGNSCGRLTIAGNKIINPGQAGDNRYDGILLSGNGTDFRVIGNVVRTDEGKYKPRYGLNIYDTVSRVTRYGNDLRCDAASGGLRDLSADPVTSPEDLLS